MPRGGRDRWETAVNRRVSNYLKIFNCFIAYSTFFLVSHRNLVSVFDLTTNEWKQEIEFKDVVQCLALC